MTQEIYALAANRNATTAIAFLDKFLPERQPAADDYPVPQFADAHTEVFTAPEDLISYLEANPTEGYGIYWDTSVKEGPIWQAMLFYTVDKYLIFGLATEPDESPKLLDELVLFAGTGIGMFGWEQPPPDTASEFVALARNAPRG